MITQNEQLTTNNSKRTANNSKSKDVKVRAYNFSLDTIKFVNSLPTQLAFRTIGDQLLRSSTSIGANLIEAKASISRKEFIKYYQIALKSGDETQYWLSLLKDSYKEHAPRCEMLLSELTEICRMLASSLITLKDKRF